MFTDENFCFFRLEKKSFLVSFLFARVSFVMCSQSLAAKDGDSKSLGWEERRRRVHKYILLILNIGWKNKTHKKREEAKVGLYLPFPPFLGWCGEKSLCFSEEEIDGEEEKDDGWRQNSDWTNVEN